MMAHSHNSFSAELTAPQFNPETQFSERNSSWQNLPQWVQYLTKLGFSWPCDDSVTRRIAMVSMPCESSAAGLVSLGALIRDLGRSDTNSIDGHYAALLRHAQQYLTACRKCDLKKCDPNTKRCGYAEKASGEIRHSQSSSRIHKISESTDFTARKLAWEIPGRGRHGPVVLFPSPTEAIRWQVRGAPPVYSQNEESQLRSEFYQKLFPTHHIFLENLQRTYLGLCLAGRTSGKGATQKEYSNYQFRIDNQEWTLSELLTVPNWSNETRISRMAYFNSRTRKMEPPGVSPALVVADGDAAFLSAISRKRFQNSDIIGIVHRVLDRERLEVIGARMMGLLQWYEIEDNPKYDISDPPPSISTLVLRREMSK